MNTDDLTKLKMKLREEVVARLPWGQGCARRVDAGGYRTFCRSGFLAGRQPAWSVCTRPVRWAPIRQGP